MKLITLKHILYVTAFVAGGFMMTSCQDKGFDWDKAHAQKINDKTEAAFAEAFEQIFGKIDPNQSWDFTVDNTKAATRAEAERLAATTVTNITTYCTIGDSYKVPDDFKTWLDENMHESVDNRAKGTALNFTMPSDGKFDLIPMYQGEAVSSWEMHMIVTPKNGNPIDMNFWKRNENIQIKQRKLTWQERAMRIKNDRTGKYLHIQLKDVTAAKNADYYEFNVDGKNDGNEIRLESDSIFKTTNVINIGMNYKVSNGANFTFSFYKEVTEKNQTKLEKVWTATGVTGVANGNTNFNESFFLQDSNFDYVQYRIEVPAAANGSKYIVMELPKTENTYQIKNFSLLVSGKPCLASVKKKLNGESNFSDPKLGKSEEVNFPKSANDKPELTTPIGPFDNTHKSAADPYKDSNEIGYCFTVVVIKNGSDTGKYLYAFTDNPADEGGFISTNGENVIFIPYSDFGKADKVQPRKLTYYNEPFCNKEVGNDVQFLMIGTKILYAEADGTLKAEDIGKNRIWEVDDSKRQDLMNPNNGYTWTYESRYRYTYEIYRFGCNGDGSTAANLQNADVKNIYTDYGDDGKEEFMNVQYDLRENSMNKTEVKGNRYQFDFSKELATYKDASISFYWETMIPWSRRTHIVDGKEIGKYLYSDNPNQLQMLAITARQAPADKDRNVVAVGCEAGMAIYKWDCDWDYNDVVFLLSSEKPITYIDRDGESEIIQKRYMVEDLGSTDDIDFNDMVVDVIQTTPMTITETTQDGKVTSTTITPGTPSQKVIVRAVGGTLPFDFIIVEGGKETKVFSKSDLLSKSSVNVNGMYNTGCVDGSTSADNNNGIGSVNSHIDYDKNYGEFTIDDNVWDYNNNNVMFRVYKKISDGVIDAYHTHDIKFPVTGETPHIIAFPVDKLWRNERRLCCWDWINDIEPALWEEPENSRKEDGSTHVTNFSKWIETNNNRTDYLNWVESKFSQGARNKIEQWLNVQYPVSGNK